MFDTAGGNLIGGAGGVYLEYWCFWLFLAAVGAGLSVAVAGMAHAVDEQRLRASALNLSFRDLWNELANEEGRLVVGGTSSSLRARFEYLPSMSDDLVLLVLKFLDAESLANLSAASRVFDLFCTQEGRENTLWKPHYEKLRKSLCVAPNLTGKRIKRMYMRLLLLHYEAEVRHFHTLYRLMNALCQMPKGSIVGIVSNIGYFESAAMSLAVSAHRQIAMTAVILSRTQDAVTFRKQTDYVGPVTFFSQENISSVLRDNPALDRPAIDAPGFLGYAVDLINLDPQDEYMRYTFVLLGLKNLSIWDTSENEDAARETGALPPDVASVALDRYEKQISDWFRRGTFQGDRIPCFIAYSHSRPRLNSKAALASHLQKLETRRDELRSSLAHST